MVSTCFYSHRGTRVKFPFYIFILFLIRFTIVCDASDCVKCHLF